MGVAASTLWASLFGTRQLKLCILGLDNAGKTTLCYQMSMGQAVATAPTVGSNTELFTYRNLQLLLYDVGGQAALRAGWAAYLQGADGIIFVLDSTDRERLGTAREELWRVVGEQSQRAVPLLLFANKQDVRACMGAAEISAALRLTELRHADWHIQACSALTGNGVTQGLDWLAARLGAKA